MTIYRNVGSCSEKKLFEEAYHLWDDDDAYKYEERDGQWVDPRSGKVIGVPITGADLTDPAFFKEVMEMATEYDAEMGHLMGDQFMAMLLHHLGYQEGVAVFDRMGKWYA